MTQVSFKPLTFIFSSEGVREDSADAGRSLDSFSGPIMNKEKRDDFKTGFPGSLSPTSAALIPAATSAL